MPLLLPESRIDRAALERLATGLLEELREMRTELEGYTTLPAESESRRWTIRSLVEDAVQLAEGHSLGELGAPELRRLTNLFYDVVLVGAEYYKLFLADPARAPRTPPVRVRPR
ncbi:MAG: hypothetical protein L3K04_04725 [Thermoplasmata archaeon]|nr:hypothetical protein [Thermoplasmata archaeon]MCI4341268.1 hypothetical protein [Thermoplasmata archaeon]